MPGEWHLRLTVNEHGDGFKFLWVGLVLTKGPGDVVHYRNGKQWTRSQLIGEHKLLLEAIEDQARLLIRSEVEVALRSTTFHQGLYTFTISVPSGGILKVVVRSGHGLPPSEGSILSGSAPSASGPSGSIGTTQSGSYVNSRGASTIQGPNSSYRS